MKFIHIADVHLGAEPDRGKPWGQRRKDEIFETFYSVLDIAIAEKVDLVLIAGDLFHRQPLKRELKELNYKFESLGDIKVALMAGNHDYLKPDSFYKGFPWSDNVFFFDTPEIGVKYFEDIQTCIYGLSYYHFEVTEPEYDRAAPDREIYRNGHHILLAHGGDEKHIPLNIKRLEASGFDYVALGHIHRPQIFPSGKMAYAGALEPIDKNDEGEHGYIIGECTQDGTFIKFVPYALREYIVLNIEVNPNRTFGYVTDALRGSILEQGEDNIYKVRITGVKDEDIRYNMDEIYRLGNIASVVDETVYNYDFEKIYYANKENIIGKYIYRVMQMDIPEDVKMKALYYGVHSLYYAGRQQV